MSSTSFGAVVVAAAVSGLQLAAQDELDEAVVVHLGPIDRGGHRAVAEHRDRVGDLQDLLETVGYEHDGDTLSCIASQRLEAAPSPQRQAG